MSEQDLLYFKIVNEIRLKRKLFHRSTSEHQFARARGLKYPNAWESTKQSSSQRYMQSGYARRITVRWVLLIEYLLSSPTDNSC